MADGQALRDSELAFQAHQLKLLGLQARRVLVPVAAASFALLWLSPSAVPSPHSWLLWMLITALLIFRWRYSRSYLRNPALALAPRVHRRVMVSVNLGIGVCTGAFCWLDFPLANALQHAAVTTLLTGLAAGALGSCAANRWAFAAYAVPMLGQLSLSWLLYGRTDPEAMSFFFAAAIFALFAILLAASNDSETWMRASFESEQKNLRLVVELRALNEELKQQKEVALAANQAKTRFLAAASHDLRQPLHALSLYSASLSLQNLQGRAKQLAESIQSSISHSLAPLLDALLDLSKLDANLIVPAPQHFALDEALAPLRPEMQATAEARGLRLLWDVDSHLHLRTDPRLLLQILRNLLDNAIKYTLQGEIRLSASRRGSMVIIAVTDSGIGIRQADQSRVFEEFYQSGNAGRDRSKGLGLGLAIVRRLADLLGLRLHLSSSPGQGTRVQIECALDAAVHPAAASGPSPEKLLSREKLGKQILVIDNESSIRDSTRGLLEDWGCSVRLASTCAEAEQLAATCHFDIVLSDFRLRASESGLDVLRVMGRAQPGAARWLITGDTSGLPWTQIRAENIRVLYKPLEAGLFLEALKAA